MTWAIRHQHTLTVLAWAAPGWLPVAWPHSFKCYLQLQHQRERKRHCFSWPHDSPEQPLNAVNESVFANVAVFVL